MREAMGRTNWTSFSSSRPLRRPCCFSVPALHAASAARAARGQLCILILKPSDSRTSPGSHRHQGRLRAVRQRMGTSALRLIPQQLALLHREREKERQRQRQQQRQRQRQRQRR